MINMILPVLVVVFSNTVYNICAKSLPNDVNPFASLSVTYTVGILCAVIMFFATSGQKNIFAEYAKMNRTSYILGMAIVGLEAGFFWLYRAGWKISIGQLVTSITLSCVLLLVGIFLYKESISPRQIIGMIVCGAGLILIAK